MQWKNENGVRGIGLPIYGEEILIGEGVRNFIIPN